MKNLKDIIIERLHINKDTGNQQYNYHPKTRDELKQLVYKLIKERGNDADLNDIDTSQITDMNEIFYQSSKFNGDISQWDVSNVKDMSYMFGESKFNGDISEWDVSNVESMNGMFEDSKFNRNISEWDVSYVQDMASMFAYSEFNGDLSKWDVSNIVDIRHMFDKSPLEKNPPKWYK